MAAAARDRVSGCDNAASSGALRSLHGEQSETGRERKSQISVQTFEGRDLEPVLELAFLVDAALGFDALLVEPTAACTHVQFKPSKTRMNRLTFLAVPLLRLDLAFFSAAGCFLPAYVFLRAESDLVIEVLPAALGALAAGTCFLTALVDDAALGGDAFEGALRPLEGFVVADLLVTAFVLDPGLATAFGTAFVAVLEVLEAGLFCSAKVKGRTETQLSRCSPLLHHRQP